jgi:uncharacterized RmlC-like cupin family protein
MAESIKPTCTLITSQEGGSYEGKQGLSYFAGISAESAGSQALCMHLLTIPPGGKANGYMKFKSSTSFCAMHALLPGRAASLA